MEFGFKVIGVGDNVVDKYMNIDRMFPGGQCMNFAVYARMLGFESAYMGVFGTDAAADLVKRTATKFGVSLERAVTRQGENGYACINVHPDGDREFIRSNKGGIAGTDPLVLSDADLEYIKQFNLIFTDDNARMDMDVALPRMKSTGVPIIYDFSVRGTDEALARICPYLDYSILSCGNLSPEETIARMTKAREYGSKAVIGTRGVEGSFFSDGEKIHQMESYTVDARDALGAGDAYSTAFLLTYVPWLNRYGTTATSEEKDTVLRRSMQAGALFAAKVCLEFGAFGHGEVIR